ncbi:hypothetical protein [Mycolicibacterium sp. HK-90]|uniref:DUF7373 family lipoprotein n=1 Tax=Mycolicibacterium sp. HK-90 TaxID=3056937 RepID=UPI0026582990|nr:hypothetical protein [Mycolicibacterium sp. HK-90]WKG00783.1 hypothetical protein QU592_15760 [Mycolicibacterium sp. HK-90]
MRDPALTANSDGAIVALLDPGNYPTKPVDPLGAAGGRGHVVESQRMAEFLVLPGDVDTSITTQGNLNGLGTALPLPTAALVDGFVTSDTQRILESHDYVAGFAAQRFGPTKAMTVMIARFPDGQTAADAAHQMAAVPAPRGSRTPLPIPRHPAALGTTFDADDGAYYVESYTAHGPYVLYQFVNSQESLTAAADLVAATLDLQAPRIDGFTPTDPAKLGELPLDPTGIYAATLRQESDAKDFTHGVYGPQGGLAYEGTTGSMGELYTETGVDTVVRGATVVYQTKDAASARRFTEVLVEDADDDTEFKPIPPVSGLPQSRCYDGTTGRGGPENKMFQCVASAGRYAFRVFSRQKLDVAQRTASQYLMLDARR